MKILVSNFLGKSISVIDGKALEEEDRIYLEESAYPHHFCIDREGDVAYIPSSVSGMVFVADLKDYKVIDSVSIGGNLIQGVLSSSQELYIANEDSNCIYVLNSKKMSPICTITVENMPHGIVIDEGHKKLFVPCEKYLVVIDTVKKEIIHKIYYGYNLWHLKINGDIIYVVTKCGKILLVDKNNFMIKHIVYNFRLPVELVINNNTKEFYVTDFIGGHIHIIEMGSNNVIQKISIEGDPLGIAINKDGDLIFVSDVKTDEINVINVSERKIIKKIKAGKEPTSIICK